MSETIFDTTDTCAKVLKLDISGEELARVAQDNGYSVEQMEAVAGILRYLKPREFFLSAFRILNIRMSRQALPAGN